MPTHIKYLPLLICAGVMFSAVLAQGASLTFLSPVSIPLSSPSTTLTAASGSVADLFTANATSVAVTLSASTGGSFTLISPSYGLSVATSSSGGAVSESCAAGVASTTISQSTGSTVYTITPTASQCLFVSNVVASTTLTSAAISWTTDVAGSSEVDYGTSTAYGSVVTAASLVTSHSLTLSSLSPGNFYHFSVKSIDAQGDIATSSDQTFATIADSVPPTVSVTSPADGSTVSGSVTLTASATDNVAVASVQFMVDGTNLGSAVTVPPYQTAWTTTNATNGSHALTVVALDTSGNTASSTVTVTVSNAAPIIVSVASSYGAPYGPVTQPSPSATPAASSSTESSASSPAAELAMLEAELAALLKQAGQPSSGSGSGPAPSVIFTRNLTLGSMGKDVAQLQRFLVTQNAGPAARKLAAHGITRNFASLTVSALAEYQKAHGIKPANGYFGSITRAYVSGHE